MNTSESSATGTSASAPSSATDVAGALARLRTRLVRANPAATAATTAAAIAADSATDNVACRALDFVASATRASATFESALPRALEVTEVLVAIDADDETLAAALIVGAIPRAEIDAVIIADAFGADVAALVSGVGRAGQIEHLAEKAGKNGGESAPAVETLRKMLLAFADDVRVVLIQLALRVVYMRSITKAAEGVRRAAAEQTRSLFAPLANRLGVFSIKWELEDFSFRFVEPELYKRIATMLDGKRVEREAFIARVVETLREALKKQGVDADIVGRPKHIWSIHRKMQAKNLAFDAVYDIRAVRVLVNSVADCYAVLALVHDVWEAIPGEFDDYIAQPKANNYQSLHTAVIGPENKTLEVQIRTHEMHNASEHGVAAHWRYKEGAGHKTAADKRFEAKIAWLRQVLEWKRELADGGGFSEAVKEGLFNDTVYVFTPQGKVIDLSAGSTPVDFAYHVHTDLGHRCRGAKVDGQIVPLNTRLQNAQRVEILAAKQGGPSRDWLNPQLGFLASPRAQAKVRNWFRQEYFEVDVAQGRQTLERELARHSATTIALEKVATALHHKELEECLAEIGRGEITPHQIEVALRELTSTSPEVAPVAELEALAAAQEPAKSEHKAASGVLMLGVNNIATLVAKCCKPMPGDEIVGFVTKTRGVMVHRQDCVNITSLTSDQRDRLMPAQWGNVGAQTFAADIEVIASDRQGLLRDISEALSHERINVTAVNTISRGNVASMRFTVDIQRQDQLTRVLRAVGDVAGVEVVRRR
jgi:GTP pyrophosphokinase